MYMYVYVYVHVCICICICTCMCLCICICIYVYVYVYVHVYVCTTHEDIPQPYMFRLNAVSLLLIQIKIEYDLKIVVAHVRNFTTRTGYFILHVRPSGVLTKAEVKNGMSSCEFGFWTAARLCYSKTLHKLTTFLPLFGPNFRDEEKERIVSLA
jgi:hypothetical protein